MTVDHERSVNGCYKWRRNDEDGGCGEYKWEMAIVGFGS